MEKSISTLERDRELISSEIFESGKFIDILYFMYDSSAITEQIFADFTNETSTRLSQVRRLVSYVCSDPELIDAFTKALLKEGLSELGIHINPLLSDPSTVNPSNEMSEKITTLPHIPPSSSYPSLSLTPRSLHPNGSQSFPETLNERPGEPIKIKVISSYAVYGKDKNDEDVYKNSSVPRGMVFIANYRNFQNNRLEERRGSQVDVKNLYDLFSQIGYKVTEPHSDLTKADTFKALREFRDNPELDDVDSCVVIIMSHGSDDKSFCAYDRSINDSDVLRLFNNQECPRLKGKPKIFIFQYCRGSLPDIGVESTVSNVSYVVNEQEEELETDAAAKGYTIPITNMPSFSDMFIINASYPGYVSFRNPLTGSWLIEAICIEFMNNAYCHDLDSLMKLVSRRIRNLNSDRGRKQVVEFRTVAFDKHFYFNPIGCNEL